MWYVDIWHGATELTKVFVTAIDFSSYRPHWAKQKIFCGLSFPSGNIAGYYDYAKNTIVVIVIPCLFEMFHCCGNVAQLITLIATWMSS
jgi:hypothetical protein